MHHVYLLEMDTCPIAKILHVTPLSIYLELDILSIILCQLEDCSIKT